jgi:hypothetical protein
MPRKEQVVLRTAYGAKVAAYSASVNDLALTRGKIVREDYDRLAEVMNNARTASEAALVALTHVSGPDNRKFGSPGMRFCNFFSQNLFMFPGARHGFERVGVG